MGTYVMNYRVCPGSFFPGPRCQTYSSARIRSVNASQHESFHTSTHLKVFSPTLNFQQGTYFWFFVLLLACQFVDSLFYSDMFGTAPVTGLCAPCSTFFSKTSISSPTMPPRTTEGKAAPEKPPKKTSWCLLHSSPCCGL